MVKVFNYNSAKLLFDNRYNTFKNLYKDKCIEVFNNHYKLRGELGPNKGDPKYLGKVDKNGSWCWENRINTHPNCLVLLYNWCIEYNENFFIDFGNTKWNKYNIEKMWNFYDENFDLYFTNDITTKYYSELKEKCSKSWNNGNISLFELVLNLKLSFGENITNIDYTFNFGNNDDMNGIDLSFNDSEGILRTIQLKSGTFTDYGDEFHVKGSPNNLHYQTDYYSYVNVSQHSHYPTSIIIFKNIKSELRKDDEGKIFFSRDLLIYKKIEFMATTEKLNTILRIASTNKIEFILEKEGDTNFINLQEGKITVNIGNIDDKQLDELLDSKIKELNQFFQD